MTLSETTLHRGDTKPTSGGSNDDIRSAPLWTKKLHAARYTNSWARVIGIDKYQYASPLACARSDAEGVTEALVADC